VETLWKKGATLEGTEKIFALPIATRMALLDYLVEVFAYQQQLDPLTLHLNKTVRRLEWRHLDVCGPSLRPGRVSLFLSLCLLLSFFLSFFPPFFLSLYLGSAMSLQIELAARMLVES
jgi:hypothetical protein